MLFPVSCRFEAELVNELTAKLLRDFCMQARPPAKHELDGSSLMDWRSTLPMWGDC